MKTTIYASHGLLAHEKEIVYTVAPTAFCDAIEVDIPDAYETAAGDIGVTLDGRDYLLKEVLANANHKGLAGKTEDRPILRWYDGQGYKTQNIQILDAK